MAFTNPYLRLMRLHQPVGIWLLLWPCLWSLALAGEGSFGVYAAFALGAVVMRGAGCVVNDILDRDFDRQVERTKTRPLASGELSVRQAAVFLGVLLMIASAIALWLGVAVLLWSAASLVLVATYPLMKRVTWWPQLFLGFTFNWGALLGWVAARESLDVPAVILYLACVFWTLGYDTIYAHQDKGDDVKVGVKSTALLFGARTKIMVGICYLLFLAGCFFVVPYATWSWLLLLLAGLQLFWQVWHVQLDVAASCRKIFISNQWLGGLIWLAVFLSH